MYKTTWHEAAEVSRVSCPLMGLISREEGTLCASARDPYLAGLRNVMSLSRTESQWQACYWLCLTGTRCDGKEREV